ncbi:MAG: histidine phosphatase family protein [Planctomycetota bacterium]
MRLYICRHGKAHPDSASGRDFDRELMSRGVQQAEYLAKELGNATPRAPLVIASPYTRTRQTAEPIAAALEADLCSDERFACDAGIHGMLSLIQHQYQRHMPALVLVGHNPDISDLAGVIVHGPLGGGVVSFKTGMCLACTINSPDPVGSGGEATVLRLEEAD